MLEINALQFEAVSDPYLVRAIGLILESSGLRPENYSAYEQVAYRSIRTARHMGLSESYSIAMFVILQWLSSEAPVIVNELDRLFKTVDADRNLTLRTLLDEVEINVRRTPSRDVN